MASSIPLQLAETVQTAHIRHNPSALLDLAPSTAADRKEAVVLEDGDGKDGDGNDEAEDGAEDQEADDDEEEKRERSDPRHRPASDGEEESEVPYSVIRSWHRTHPFSGGEGSGVVHKGDDGHDHGGANADALRQRYSSGHEQQGAHGPYRAQLPPMPDLRFEQSYLRSLAGAKTRWHVALITVRDQVVMPLVQGVLYNLAVCGWQHWNVGARLSGQLVGTRLRRWWYEVNYWPLPEAEKTRAR